MRPKNNFLFMTFVGLTLATFSYSVAVHSAPKAVPDKGKVSGKAILNPNSQEKSATSSGSWKDSLNTSPAPSQAQQPIVLQKNYDRQKRHQSGIAYYYGKPENEADTNSHLSLSYRYNLQMTIDFGHQFGLDLSSDYLILNYGMKFGCCYSLPYSSYYKVGANTWWSHSDFVSNIVNFRRYFGVVGFGFDDLFYLKRSLQLEATAALGISGTMAGLALYYRF